MGRPGSGRYTTYVPVTTAKTTRLQKLFPGGMSELYDGESSNASAAAKAATRAVGVLNGVGDPDLFGAGVDLKYGDAPDTTEVEWKNAGDPATAYFPDLSSPGPGKTDGVDKDVNPGLNTTDVKPNFDASNPTVNTTSPSATSNRLGTLSIGDDLELGKSSVK